VLQNRTIHELLTRRDRLLVIRTRGGQLILQRRRQALRARQYRRHQQPALRAVVIGFRRRPDPDGGTARPTAASRPYRADRRRKLPPQGQTQDWTGKDQTVVPRMPGGLIYSDVSDGKWVGFQPTLTRRTLGAKPRSCATRDTLVSGCSDSRTASRLNPFVKCLLFCFVPSLTSPGMIMPSDLSRGAGQAYTLSDYQSALAPSPAFWLRSNTANSLSSRCRKLRFSVSSTNAVRIELNAISRYS